MKNQIQDNSVRLDKWLWAARFYKTRSLAKAMIEGGKVHYNGQRAKTSKIVEIGAIIRLRQGNEEKEVAVVALSDQRRGAPEAQKLYRETEQSIEAREQRKAATLSMPYSDHRPNKKERRDLLKFKQINSDIL
ncbi:Heat shock protein 15 [Bibersteinia trehalosi USDA-ARS-USMARC-188]|uniref:Heat shock protein 15 n=2 Tax=Bibersteinia trehalosi TaxID=47735 RepID=A0A4V7IBS2_BIBTR|nr:ribosome-associated heat shock protein Hsp15 [Bibersteinia trehalosi]AGH37641.1 Heat shock protein 15 [Bibersteinia trehalosi USDA-ARS-USMARC-192]AHG82550.1 Heat shock protein 15 [Bibersteinia trehalosi USDA-ARS-USMARC-188]AHG84884.1 Heat shock protein 15 [Bibersteinia trehalosi USDA-ARS-USMARC-189]TCT12312.1 heat shock protein Hsp15 [Bibersteinia trehalosi]